MKFIIYKYDDLPNDVVLSELVEYLYIYTWTLNVYITLTVQIVSIWPNTEILILFSNKILLFVFC